jgi:FtsP/CotA-like multicopper oxidase with cupredoxin domain
VQIGSDGGLLGAPVSHRQIDVAPGERFDVVVDFAGMPVGSAVTMVNLLGTGGDTGLVMRFVVARPGRDDGTVPARLAEIEPPAVGPSTRRRDFRFTRGSADGGLGHVAWTINGQAFDPDTALADVALGETEIWRFGTDLHHPVHVHLDPFQVLARGSFPGAGPSDGGRKDTVDLRPAEDVTVAVRFTDHPGRFVLHCHNLEHEDMAMMGTFRTT